MWSWVVLQKAFVQNQVASCKVDFCGVLGFFYEDGLYRIIQTELAFSERCFEPSTPQAAVLLCRSIISHFAPDEGEERPVRAVSRGREWGPRQSGLSAC